MSSRYILAGNLPSFKGTLVTWVWAAGKANRGDLAKRNANAVVDQVSSFLKQSSSSRIPFMRIAFPSFFLCRKKKSTSSLRPAHALKKTRVRLTDVSIYICRELPDAASLQEASSGSFDYAVASAPAALKMTKWESIVQPHNGRRDDVSIYICRELPDAASLQDASSGSFDYAVASAPAALKMTRWESIVQPPAPQRR